jgi:hypothetical protein
MFPGPLIHKYGPLIINNLVKKGVKLIDAIFIGKKRRKVVSILRSKTYLCSLKNKAVSSVVFILKISVKHKYSSNV